MFNCMETANQYIPGVCNIGNEEIKKRKQAGWTGLIVTVALWVLLVWAEVSPLWRLTLFLPAMMSATGFLQAYSHFCVYFGFANLFNFGDVGKTDSVEQAEFRAKDKKKAWNILLSSILIGLGVAAFAYYV